MPKKPTTTLIFDFDGTIADTMSTLLKIANRFAQKYGYPEITNELEINMRDKTSEGITRYFPIPKYKLPFLVRDVRKALAKDIASIAPIPGVHEALVTLKTSGYTLGIVTSNSKETVAKFLKANDLDMFDFVYGSTIFGKGKLLKKILDRHQLTKETVFYIGDETRDIDAARHAEVKVISVTWGLSSSRVLAAHKPDFLVKNPDQLEQTVQEK